MNTLKIQETRSILPRRQIAIPFSELGIGEGFRGHGLSVSEREQVAIKVSSDEYLVLSDRTDFKRNRLAPDKDCIPCIIVVKYQEHLMGVQR